MSEKVRAKRVKLRYYAESEYDSPKKIRVYLKDLERESIRSIILKSNSIKSEGGLAKEINLSDV